VQITNEIEIQNLKTTKPLLIHLPFGVAVKLPFSTLTGLNDDNTKEG
jgi:hypothetical protein